MKAGENSTFSPMLVEANGETPSAPQPLVLSIASPQPQQASVDGVGPCSTSGDELAVSKEDLRPGTSSVYSAGFNFVNSIVGAGVIGIPFALQQCGLVLGLFFLFLVAYLINRSVLMIVKCGIQAKIYDFEELAEHLLGRKGYFAALVGMFLFAYGAMVAYLVIIGDTLPLAFEYMAPGSPLTQRNLDIVLVCVFIMLPLCLLRDLNSLSWTSLLSIVSDIILMVLIMIAAPSASKHQDEHFTAANVWDMNYTVFAGIGTMSFAFVCQHNSFLIFKSLKVQTYQNFKVVCNGSVSVALCISLGIGCTGFFYFYPNVQGDVLNNFGSSSSALCVARIFLAMTMLFTFPMEVVVSRHCFLSILHRIRKDNITIDEILQSIHGGAAEPTFHGEYVTESDFPVHIEDHRTSGHGDSGDGSGLYALPSGGSADDASAAASSGFIPDVVTFEDTRDDADIANDREEMDVSKGKFGKKYGKLRSGSSDNTHHYLSDGGGADESDMEIGQRQGERAQPTAKKCTQEKSVEMSTIASGSREIRKHKLEPANKADTTESTWSESQTQSLSDTQSSAATTTAYAGNIAGDICIRALALVKHTYHSNVDDPARVEWLAVTLLLWGSAMGIALVFRDLGVVSGLTGAVAASMIGYMLPSALFTATHRAELRGALARAFPRVPTSDAELYCDTAAEFTDDHSSRVTWQSALRGCNVVCATQWRRAAEFKHFYLPLFMMVFGVVAMLVGIATIANGS